MQGEAGIDERDPRAEEAGIVLPPGLLQPFLLRFRREDLHIMAFFSGHPDYEAVEAMIRYRGDGTPSIRAILTRHDQSQIDHVNDDDLSAEGHGVTRQTCRRDIALAIEALPGRRHARLEFRLACGRACRARHHDRRRAGSQARRHLRSRQPLAQHAACR